jgi:hypothetical protein
MCANKTKIIFTDILTDIESENNADSAAPFTGTVNHTLVTYNELRAALRLDLSCAAPLRVASHLKLYTALAGMLGFKLGEEEAELVLSVSF